MYLASYILFYISVAAATSLKVSENNGNSVFVELLRGRDGLPGRDGSPGRDGEQGPAGPPGPPGPQSGGAIYTRWGKTSCPQTPGTEMVYSGMTGGTLYGEEGGGANYLCMPTDPEYNPALTYRPGVNGGSHIYGGSYQGPLQGSHAHNPPCAVCQVTTRPTVVMIPAKASCPPTWTREYYGYIMADYVGVPNNIRGRTMFVCVDEDQESFPGGSTTTIGALFYHVEAHCGSGLRCPPYDREKELNCVVCTK